MSEAEDHPERGDQPKHDDQLEQSENHPERDAEENKLINFEWTPELVKIGISRGDIHPSIGPHKFSNGHPDCTYRPGMTLPDPANTRECLRWVGLSDKKIIEVEQKFNELYPDYQAPRSGHDSKVFTRGFSDITFPLIEKMADLFMQGVRNNRDDDYDYTTHKGYIEKGIQLGLRPEFAIFCGLYKDDPRAINDPHLFEELWFTIKSPQSAIDEMIILFWMELKEYMVTRLLYEGKAWSNYGRWVVREGETLDEAKARVDDRERLRLKEQAIKEQEAKFEREQQEEERLYAEDIARWAEEDRLEAEMQQSDKACSAEG
ncbi:hypothetical protein N7471_008386 [Penicillium samsonianum]|uniref:uncharacterized protein n=1 Tax=Penicillium samsonianum TaxID=1882272 RepID=UPI002546E86B|nr:uncharacterized protein N7471_008386 [Penicillium samsonianum]KAJ6133171.1 hypothetical protein N7471_008386 [Penicillium samsonianum]